MDDVAEAAGSGNSKVSYSQNYEEVYIERVFPDICDGFYIDVGAYHPTDDSVTKYFYDKGWSGINVEPGPLFETFACRDRDLNLKVAISDRSGWATFVFEKEAPGTSKLVGGQAQGPEDAETSTGETSTVECLTLEELVSRYAPDQHIHFLKLDIEGMEDAVVRGTDWRRLRPELLVIESTFASTNIRRDGSWLPYLEEMGYHEVFFDGINVYYLRTESLARGSTLDRPVNVLDGFTKRGHADYLLEEVGRRCAHLDAHLHSLKMDMGREIAARQAEVAWLTERRQAADTAYAASLTDYRWLKDQHDALNALREEEGVASRAEVAWLTRRLEAANAVLATTREENSSLKEERDALHARLDAERERGEARIAAIREQVQQAERDRDHVRNTLFEPERRARLRLERDLEEQRTVKGMLLWLLSASYRQSRLELHVGEEET